MAKVHPNGPLSENFWLLRHLQKDLSDLMYNLDHILVYIVDIQVISKFNLTIRCFNLS